ncbi:MAG TPA: hypothetical protein VIJ11_03360 [Galbitalea sp.]
MRVETRARSAELAALSYLDPARQDAVLLVEVVASLKPLVLARLAAHGMTGDCEVVLADLQASLWQKIAVHGVADSRWFGGFANRAAQWVVADHINGVNSRRAYALSDLDGTLEVASNDTDPLDRLEAENTAMIVLRYVQAGVSPDAWEAFCSSVPSGPAPSRRTRSARSAVRTVSIVVFAALQLASDRQGLSVAALAARCVPATSSARPQAVSETARLNRLAWRVYREQSPRW